MVIKDSLIEKKIYKSLRKVVPSRLEEEIRFFVFVWCGFSYQAMEMVALVMWSTNIDKGHFMYIVGLEHRFNHGQD